MYDFLFWYWKSVRISLHILRQCIFYFSLFYVFIFRGFSNVSISSFSVVFDWIYSHIFRLLNTTVDTHLNFDLFILSSLNQFTQFAPPPGIILIAPLVLALTQTTFTMYIFLSHSTIVEMGFSLRLMGCLLTHSYHIFICWMRLFLQT